MIRQALGLIEAVGMPAAIAAADAAAKAANIRLLGYELTKGGGLVTVKLEGDVAAVKAAVEAGAAEARRVHDVRSVHVIPRPAGDTGKMVLAEGALREATAESETVDTETKDPIKRETGAREPEVRQTGNVEGNAIKADANPTGSEENDSGTNATTAPGGPGEKGVKTTETTRASIPDKTGTGEETGGRDEPDDGPKNRGAKKKNKKG
ncbi:BMC domain-containing protein [Thermincola ferriacetica]